MIKRYNIEYERIKQIDPFEELPRVHIGPISPIKEEKMEKLSSKEIFNYLKEYQEHEHSFSDSKVGLGRVLRNIVGKRPNEFTENFLSSFLELKTFYNDKEIRSSGNSILSIITNLNLFL